jgi:hypothetical protein
MAQAVPITTTIPTASPQTLYLPVIQYRTGAVYVPESTLADLTRDCVINDVACGTWGRVLKVLAVDPSTGKSWDASAEIARQALYQALDRYGRTLMPRACREFVEEHLGVNAVRSATLHAA